MTERMILLTANAMKELAAALGSLFELDRMAGCSDRYFRQVCTAKINAIRAAGFREKLEIEAKMTIRSAQKAPKNEEE